MVDENDQRPVPYFVLSFLRDRAGLDCESANRSDGKILDLRDQVEPPVTEIGSCVVTPDGRAVDLRPQLTWSLIAKIKIYHSDSREQIAQGAFYQS